MANQFYRYEPTQNPRAAANAKDREARIAAAKLRNPAGPQNQPGSGQLTPNTYAMPAAPRPSQLPQRTAPAASGTAGVTNPPPAGNLAPQTFTQITLASRARNPYDFASGRGTTADAERWQRNNSGSIRSQVYNPRTWTPQIQPGTETNLQSPEIQRELDAAAGDDVGTTNQMRAEIAKAQGTEGRTKTQYGTVQVKGMVPKAEAVVSAGATQAAPAANWQQSVMQKHEAIGQAGSPENAAYVAAYKAKKATGENFDPSALADEVMQQMQQPPALALNQTAQQPMLDVYRPLAAPSTASATTPPVAGSESKPDLGGMTAASESGRGRISKKLDTYAPTQSPEYYGSAAERAARWFKKGPWDTIKRAATGTSDISKE